jgi:pimeloyl-ACP methyl ester carboxylesterase
MATVRLRTSTAVAAAALMATLVPAGGAAGAPAAGPPPDPTAGYDAPPVDWEPCEASIYGPALPDNYRCAFYPVPLDYADPDGGTVDVAVVKRLADDPGVRLGSLFVNPGGPGGSGFDIVAFAGDFLFDPAVSSAYDIVGFDPRGIVASAPLQCFEGRENPGEYLDWFLWPRDRHEIRASVDNAERLDDACRRVGGDIRDNMSSSDVVSDMEVLRRAVGDDEMNFVGYSYGSYLAAVYANRYPDRVGAIVADGVIDPVEWATGDEPRESRRVPLEGRLRSDLGAQATLEEFFRLCDEAGPEGCAFAPDSAARYEALYADFEADPLVVSFPRGVFDEQFLASVTLGSMYSSLGWRFLAEDLVFFEQIAAAERPLTRSTEAEIERRLARLPYPPFYIGNEQFLGVVCSDSDSPRRISAWTRWAEQAVGPLGQLWAWNDRQCVEWSGEDEDRYQGPFTADTANPVLVASTRFDPATDYSGAVALDEYLPNSILLTVEGWGHTTPFLSQCADAITTAYLLRQDLEGGEFTCEQDIGPFDIPEEPAVPEDQAEALVGPPDPIAGAADALEAAGDPETAQRLREREAFIGLAGTRRPG